MNKPLGLSEGTIQYFLEKPLEKLEQYRKRAIIKQSIREWDYIIWRKKGSKETVIYT